jgi:hypothetical protein
MVILFDYIYLTDCTIITTLSPKTLIRLSNFLKIILRGVELKDGKKLFQEFIQEFKI